ncbi:MAG: hypothetical protein ACLP1Y_13455 [Candidatus Acidiferrales bacterium]
MSPFRSPHKTIEVAAAKESPDDEDSIGNVVDAVLNFPHICRLPDPLEAMIRSRLVSAEISYLRKTGPGVREEDVVDLLNDFADRFGAPEYAKTSLAQVRFIRMKLAIGEPLFMGSGTAVTPSRVGGSVSPVMSPTQAAHLILTLVDQKFMNSEFQVSPEKWDVSKVRRAPTTPGTSVTAESNPKIREMYDLFFNRPQVLSLADGTGLLQEAFAKLKID